MWTSCDGRISNCAKNLIGPGCTMKFKSWCKTRPPIVQLQRLLRIFGLCQHTKLEAFGVTETYLVAAFNPTKPGEGLFWPPGFCFRHNFFTNAWNGLLFSKFSQNLLGNALKHILSQKKNFFGSTSFDLKLQRIFNFFKKKLCF